MANIIKLRGKSPVIDESCWIADDAVIAGDVTLGPQCSVWFKVVIRGDVCSIRIGDKCNIQDGVIIHGTYNKSNTVLGNNVSVGHGAILHGCTVHDDVLVGMRAVIMDHAVVESHCLVAAGAVVLEGSHLKSGYIYGGTPAKIIKELDQEAIRWHISRTADAYVMYSSWYQS